jgi:hypothetical protein
VIPNDWISPSTYELLKKKSMVRHRNQPERANELGKMVKASLRADRKIRVEKVAVQAATLLANNNTNETYQYLQGW